MSVRRLGARVVVLALLAAGIAAGPTSASAATDTTAPTLSGVRAVATTVSAGDPVLLAYSIHDDGPGPFGVDARFYGPDNNAYFFVTLGSQGAFTWLDTVGPAVGTVPVGTPGGVYTLDYVRVVDAAGNTTMYTATGADSVPAPPVANPAIDTTAVKVTVVQPLAADVTAPVLHSMSMVSPVPTRHLGEFATFDLSFSDERSPIVEARVLVRDPTSKLVAATQGDGDFVHSRISLWIPTDAPTGRWTVAGVTVTDSSGNIRSYAPSASGPVPAWLAFDVTTGAIRPDAVRTFDYRYEATVRTAVSTVAVVRGGTAVLSGTVSFLGKPVQYPLLAVYASSAGAHVLVGYVHGNRTGAFSRPVRVVAATRFTTLFLGSDRGPRAPATTGIDRTVGVGTAQRLAVASSVVHAPAGTVRSLTVRLLPSRRGALLRLQVLRGTRWVDAGGYRTNASGVATARLAHPRTSMRLRWVVTYDGTHLPAVSAVVRLLSR